MPGERERRARCPARRGDHNSACSFGRAGHRSVHNAKGELIVGANWKITSWGYPVVLLVRHPESALHTPRARDNVVGGAGSGPE